MIALQTLDAGHGPAANVNSGGDVKMGVHAPRVRDGGPVGTKATDAESKNVPPKTNFGDVLKNLAGKESLLKTGREESRGNLNSKDEGLKLRSRRKTTDMLDSRLEVRRNDSGLKLDAGDEQVTLPVDLIAVLQSVEPEDVEELPVVDAEAPKPRLAGDILGAESLRTTVAVSGEKAKAPVGTASERGDLAHKTADRKGTAKLEVLDFRKGLASAEAPKRAFQPNVQADDPRLAEVGQEQNERAATSKSDASRNQAAPQADLSADSLPAVDTRPVSSAQGEAKIELPASENAAAMRARLKDEGNAAIVEKARFVLKDGDNGEIRLILKPERLGEVRIRLELQDNRIAGRIIVENSSVRDTFQQNLADLSRAFRESGFESASLDVSVGDDQGEPNADGGNGRRHPGELAMDEAGTVLDADYGFSDRRVNLIA